MGQVGWIEGSNKFDEIKIETINIINIKMKLVEKIWGSQLVKIFYKILENILHHNQFKNVKSEVNGRYERS